MAVAHDGEANLTDTTSDAPPTWTLVGKTTAGSNRIAIVALSFLRYGRQGSVPSVTYGGNAMTAVVTKESNDGDHGWFVGLYSYANPPTAATDVVVTTYVDYAAVGGISCVSYNGAAGIRSGSATSADALTVDVTSATGDMVVDACCYQNIGSQPTTSAGSGQTSILTGQISTYRLGAFGHSREAGASSVTMSWAAFDQYDQNKVIAAASIEAAASSPTLPVSLLRTRAFGIDPFVSL